MRVCAGDYTEGQTVTEVSSIKAFSKAQGRRTAANVDTGLVKRKLFVAPLRTKYVYVHISHPQEVSQTHAPYNRKTSIPKTNISVYNFKEETNEMVHSQHRFLWRWKWDLSENRSDIPRKF
jgi:hypothetical protein